MEEQIKLSGVTVDCKDTKVLSDFYIRMLHWEKIYEDDGFTIIASSSDVKISFQKNIYHVAPVWPESPDTQQQQTHLDFKVRDKAQMELMVEHAIECGATKAAEQQYSDLWTVMIDPVGHPFCFDTL